MKIYLFIIFLLIIDTTYSQIIDHFDDGEFSVSPAWSGDSSDFNVNLSGQLQLHLNRKSHYFLPVEIPRSNGRRNLLPLELL